jgi:hypothetical protein
MNIMSGLVLFVIMYFSYLYSMEWSTSYTYGETKINVKKGSPYDLDGKIDYIVFGSNEQRLLAKSFVDGYFVGHITIFRRKSLYIEHKNADSDFDNDTYVSCYNDLRARSEKNLSKKCLKSFAIEVIEPLLFTSQYSGEYYYYAEKKNLDHKNWFYGTKQFGVEAIEDASHDLALCYEKVLAKGLRIGEGKNKSIALPTLGTAVDFPREKAAPIAIKTILEFVKNNPKAYSRIELFVKKRSDLVLYRTLLADVIENDT